MAETFPQVDLEALGDPVCEYCSTRIDEPDRDCPALDGGVCAP